MSLFLRQCSRSRLRHSAFACPTRWKSTWDKSLDLRTTADDSAEKPPKAPEITQDSAHSQPTKAVKKSADAALKDVAIYRLHCKSSANNTITAIADPEGKILGHWSGGTVGFKKGTRESWEAGYQSTIRCFRMAEQILQDNPNAGLGLFFKGWGQGRDAFKSAILTAEGEKIRDKIVFLQDRTPLKIGGTRAKKMARK